MGNNCSICKKIFKTRTFNLDNRHEELDYHSLSSLTNESIKTRDTRVTNIVRLTNSSDPDDVKFNWGHMQSLYLECKASLPASEQILTLEVLEHVQKLLNSLLLDILPVSRKLLNCLLEIDKTFPTTFDQCSQKSTTQPITINLDQRLRMHFISMIFLHRRIAENYLQKPDEVNNLLNLVAVSHSYMKIDYTHVRLMDLAVGRFLVTNDLINDESAEAIIVYFNTITNIISEHMQTLRRRTNATYDISNKHKSTQSPTRDNYRCSKQWGNLVNDLRMEVSHAINWSLDTAQDKDSINSITSST